MVAKNYLTEDEFLEGKVFDINNPKANKPDYKKDIAFIIGNEAAGISKDILDIVEKKIKIPMLGEVESLNAAVAGSILMYEAARQRRL